MQSDRAALAELISQLEANTVELEKEGPGEPISDFLSSRVVYMEKKAYETINKLNVVRDQVLTNSGD